MNRFLCFNLPLIIANVFTPSSCNVVVNASRQGALATIFSGLVCAPISIKKALMAQLKKVEALWYDKAGHEVMPLAIKLLDWDEARVVRILLANAFYFSCYFTLIS